MIVSVCGADSRPSNEETKSDFEGEQATMANPNRRKGTRAELAVAKFFHDHGHPKAERARCGWSDDRGDIDGVEDLTVEVKDQRRHDIGCWLKELEIEQKNRGTNHGVCAVKKQGAVEVDTWYAIMTMTEFLKLWNAYKKIDDSPASAHTDPI